MGSSHAITTSNLMLLHVIKTVQYSIIGSSSRGDGDLLLLWWQRAHIQEESASLIAETWFSCTTTNQLYCQQHTQHFLRQEDCHRHDIFNNQFHRDCHVFVVSCFQKSLTSLVICSICLQFCKSWFSVLFILNRANKQNIALLFQCFNIWITLIMCAHNSPASNITCVGQRQVIFDFYIVVFLYVVHNTAPSLFR